MLRNRAFSSPWFSAGLVLGMGLGGGADGFRGARAAEPDGTTPSDGQRQEAETEKGKEKEKETGASTADQALIRGMSGSFSITSPEGWVVDTEAGRGDGLQAVLYPDKGSWDDSAAVMYTNILDKERQGVVSAEDYMQRYLKVMSLNSPTLSHKRQPPVPLASGHSADLYRLSGGEFGNMEAIAVLEEPGSIILLVLSARTREAFENSHAAFLNMVRSYRPQPHPPLAPQEQHPLGEKLIIPGKKP